MSHIPDLVICLPMGPLTYVFLSLNFCKLVVSVKNCKFGDFPGGQWLRLCAPNAGDEGMGSISGGENPICSVAKPSPPPPEKKKINNMGRETQQQR